MGSAFDSLTGLFVSAGINTMDGEEPSRSKRILIRAYLTDTSAGQKAESYNTSALTICFLSWKELEAEVKRNEAN